MIFKFLFFCFLVDLSAQITAEKRSKRDMWGSTENDVKVGFHLYTKSNPKEPQPLEMNNLKSFQESRFNPLNQIKIIIHGYQENYTHLHDSSQVILRGYQCNAGDFNVILVEYKSEYGIIGFDYYYICDKIVDIIGKKIAAFIEFIKKSFTKITNKSIDLIGFSLGGQIAGLAGNLIKGKLNSIAALDPASPGFEKKSIERKLDGYDADYVEVIHTSGLSGLEKDEVLGTSDIFLNNFFADSRQPGCEDAVFSTSCNHNYAPQFFAKSLCKKEPLLAYECTKDDYYKKKCTNDPSKKSVIFAGNPLRPKTGRYFLSQTNDL